MLPDFDVLLELPDYFLSEFSRLGFGAFRILVRRAADVDHEPNVGRGFVDRGDRGDGAVVDHPPTFGHRDSQTSVDGLHSAVDVFDLLVVVAFEGDGEVDKGHRFVEVVAGEHGHDWRVVHVLEMRKVHAVFEHVLRVHFQALAVQPLLRVVVADVAVVIESGEYVRHVEVRFTALDVVPDVDRLVALHHRIRADPFTAIGTILVGNADVAALLAPLPAVKRALQYLADDFAAETQVRAQMFAVSVHHGELAGLGPPGNHLLAEVLHLVYVADADLVGPCDLEPAGRFHRQRRLGHPSSSFLRFQGDVTNDSALGHKFIVGTMKL